MTGISSIGPGGSGLANSVQAGPGKEAAPSNGGLSPGSSDTTVTTTNVDGSVTTTVTSASGAVVSTSVSGSANKGRGPGSAGSARLDIDA